MESHVDDDEAAITISRLLREQFALVETYCNAATRLANVAEDEQQQQQPNSSYYDHRSAASSWITATQALRYAIQRVQRHVAEMDTAVMSLRRSVETNEDDDDFVAVEIAAKEHYERTCRILTSIFTHSASFHGSNGFVPSPTRDSDVDVRLVALATLRASIQKTQKMMEVSPINS